MRFCICILLLVASFANQTLGTYDCIKQCVCEKRGNQLIARCSISDLSSVPQPEEDYHINVLHLEFKHLSTLTTEDFESFQYLRELYARDNAISSIETGVFNSSNSSSNSTLKRLEILDLSGNALEVLPAGSFASLHNLTTLTLNRNVIADIASKAFTGLHDLKVLDLERNNITSIQDGTFDDLKTLGKLRLGKNQLTNLPATEFQTLTHLDLSHNRFSSVPNVTAQKLIDINFSWNLFENLHSGSFSGTPHLQYIYLGYCKLSYVNYDVFSKLTNLIYLDLASNSIVNFPASEMPTLQFLILGDNQIKSVTRNLSYIGSNITTLDLSNNEIEYLDPKIFDSPSLNELLIFYNPFHCGCKLVEFANWIILNMDIVKNNESILCKEPLSGSGVTVESFVKTLHCNDTTEAPTRKENFFLAMSIVVLLISLLLILIMLVLCQKSHQRAQRRREGDDRGLSENGDIRLMPSKSLCTSCKMSCSCLNCFKFGMPSRGRVFSEEMRDLMIASPITSPIDKHAPTSL